MKTIIVRFNFTNDEWKKYKEKYSNAEIRMILEEGGLGELSQLLIDTD